MNKTAREIEEKNRALICAVYLASYVNTKIIIRTATYSGFYYFISG